VARSGSPAVLQPKAVCVGSAANQCHKEVLRIVPSGQVNDLCRDVVRAKCGQEFHSSISTSPQTVNACQLSLPQVMAEPRAAFIYVQSARDNRKCITLAQSLVLLVLSPSPLPSTLPQLPKAWVIYRSNRKTPRSEHTLPPVTTEDISSRKQGYRRDHLDPSNVPTRDKHGSLTASFVPAVTPS